MLEKNQHWYYDSVLDQPILCRFRNFILIFGTEKVKKFWDENNQGLTEKILSFFQKKQESKIQQITHKLKENNQTNFTKVLLGINDKNNQLIQQFKYFEECREFEIFFLNKLNFTNQYQA